MRASVGQTAPRPRGGATCAAPADSRGRGVHVCRWRAERELRPRAVLCSVPGLPSAGGPRETPLPRSREGQGSPASPRGIAQDKLAASSGCRPCPPGPSGRQHSRLLEAPHAVQDVELLPPFGEIHLPVNIVWVS